MVDDYSIKEFDRSQLMPLKGRWTFLCISLLATCLLSFYFFWAYSQIFKIILNDENFLRHGGMSSKEEFRQILGLQATDAFMHISIAGMLFGMAAIAAVIAVCLFYHRACKNLYVYGLPSVGYSPGWAVGWFFIPFANLVMPLLVTNQLWKGSVAIKEGQHEMDWHRNKLSPWIYVWYGAFLAGIVFYMVCMIQFQTSMIKAAIMHDDPMALVSMMQDLFDKITLFFMGYAALWTIQGFGLIMTTKKMADLQDGL